MTDEEKPTGVPIAVIADTVSRTTCDMDTVDMVALVIAGKDGNLVFTQHSGPTGASLQTRMVVHFGLLRLAHQIAEQLDCSAKLITAAGKVSEEGGGGGVN